MKSQSNEDDMAYLNNCFCEINANVTYSTNRRFLSACCCANLVLNAELNTTGKTGLGPFLMEAAVCLGGTSPSKYTQGKNNCSVWS